MARRVKAKRRARTSKNTSSKARRRRRTTTRRTPKRRTPRNRSHRLPEVARRVVRALASMRDGASFSVAARRERLKPETFRRHAGKALRQKHPGSRLHAAPTDSLRREMLVQTKAGPERLVIRGLKQARLISAHANAIAQFNRDGKVYGLRQFEGTTIRSRGRVFKLLTDPAKLRELGEADALKLDSLYESD